MIISSDAMRTILHFRTRLQPDTFLYKLPSILPSAQSEGPGL